MRSHLQDAHKTDLAKLTDAQLEKSDLFVCRECDGCVFTSLVQLNNHVRSRHYETRTKSNLQIVEEALFKELADSFESEWEDGLAFLRELELSPPTFRQPLTTTIKWRLENVISDTFMATINASNEALKPLDNSIPRRPGFDSWEVVQLQILFEQLVLFPLSIEQRRQRKSVNEIIHERLRRFRQGKIRSLYEESRQIKAKHHANKLKNQSKSNDQLNQRRTSTITRQPTQG